MRRFRIREAKAGPARGARFILAGIGALMAVLLCAQHLQAASAKSTYLAADACYHRLIKQPERMKYRHNWLGCIDQFRSAHRLDPNGPWAAASLYMAGRLHSELYRLSNKASDRQEAVDLYERIVNRYRKSRYHQKAVAALKDMGGASPAKKAAAAPKTNRGSAAKREAAPPKVADAKTEKAFQAAESCANDLSLNPEKRKYRHNWLNCIKKYQAIHQKDPRGPHAAASLYQSGSLYLQLYRYSRRAGDREQAFEIFERVASDFKESSYAGRARLDLGKDPGSPSPPPETGVASVPDLPPPPIEAPDPATETGNGPNIVTGLRYWSNPRYTRIVVDATRDTAYIHRLLKKDPTLGKPQRLYLDFENSRLKNDVQREVPINDNLLLDARAGQYTPDSVRVVVDIKSFDNYKVFSLKNPFRVVIDVWGKKEGPAMAAVEGVPAAPPAEGAGLPASALAKQLVLGVRRIVIDPGHGGKDFGAPGYHKGVHEKHIVLQIARRLAKKVNSQLGLEVVLTRSTDRYLTLEERTAIANTRNADLFVSIHTNAARKRDAHGIETFFLNLATDADAILVAARENATSTKNISDLQTILSDLMQNAKINESSRLAANVQQSLYGHLKPRYSDIRSKGVKQAPFYVLLGAEMPAILIETSFISNPRECKRLTDPAYQDHLCDGIIEGIRSYIREINPAAFADGPAATGTRG